MHDRHCHDLMQNKHLFQKTLKSDLHIAKLLQPLGDFRPLDTTNPTGLPQIPRTLDWVGGLLIRPTNPSSSDISATTTNPNAAVRRKLSIMTVMTVAMNPWCGSGTTTEGYEHYIVRRATAK